MFLDGKEKGRVFRADIHQYTSLEVHFGAFSSIVGLVGQKTDDFVKGCLVATGVFVYVFEIQ